MGQKKRKEKLICPCITFLSFSAQEGLAIPKISYIAESCAKGSNQQMTLQGQP